MKTFFSILFCVFFYFNLSAVEIFVSPDGKSLNEGLREARELRRTGKVAANEPVKITLKGGVYSLYEPLFIRPEDNGTENSPTIFEAVVGENATISGGVRITGWKREGKFFTATVPEFNGTDFNFRQMWVNGKKAVRARNVADFSKMDRIIRNDKDNQILWVPASSVKKIQKAKNAELIIHQMWEIAILRIKSIDIQGDSAAVRFHNPESRIQFEHPWPQPFTKPGFMSAFYLTNALELLDEAGEYYFDKAKRKLYYLPLPSENMNTAEVFVPYLENLVEITGTIDHPVQHVYFKNVNFSHSGWTRPSEKGHVPLQAAMYLIDAYKLRPPGAPGNQNKGIENQAWIGRPAAAVRILAADNCVFDGCKFEHLGGSGLDFEHATHYNTVKNSEFLDIAYNGLQIGKFSDVGFETHLAYNPADRREICSHQLISNNLIKDCGNEDWGSVGILAGYVSDTRIEHNEICEIPYSGISVGWGWTKTVNCMKNNVIHANYIHHYAKNNHDVAGIYTLSVQSKTEITENRIDSISTSPYAHDPNHWYYLYTDEGSSFITIKDNWCPAEKFLKNANGPGNTWENNGPMVSEEIKMKAGRKK